MVASSTQPYIDMNRIESVFISLQQFRQVAELFFQPEAVTRRGQNLFITRDDGLVLRISADIDVAALGETHRNCNVNVSVCHRQDLAEPPRFTCDARWTVQADHMGRPRSEWTPGPHRDAAVPLEPNSSDFGWAASIAARIMIHAGKDSPSLDGLHEILEEADA